MHFVALRMLTADRGKYFGLISTIAFASFLLANQSSIFAGIMARTGSQIRDVVDADVWVMDPATQYVEEVTPLRDQDLYRVRGVPGVRWAVRAFRGLATATAPDGRFRTVILLGVDDESLVGVPHGRMLLGRLEDLRQPDAAIIDRAGYEYFFPGQPLATGRTFELNDRRVHVVGIAEASAPFATFPVFYVRYSRAVTLVGRERNQMSYVLAAPVAGLSPDALATRIARATGLKALTREGFFWATIGYYLRNTGIPVNFGITIGIALLVGVVVCGQTFYIFTIENLKQFGALKAIGVTNGRLVGMILLQAVVVGALGYSLGIGLVAIFFEITLTQTPTRGLVLLWQNVAGTGVIVLAIVTLASLLSIRRVLVLEPAVVFRG
jgi:putative ABC transport system permease protein